MTRPIALITGATGGLGQAFAASLARHGYDLVLTSRREAELNRLAEQVRGAHGVECTVLPCDLGAPAARAELIAAIRSRELAVEILINNAGFGEYRPFVETDPTILTGMVALNCEALTDLTREFLPGMVERGHGTIIQVASTAAFQPVPDMAVYAATKSYVLSFTQALTTELKGTGVRVQALCPGPTETGFFERAHADHVMTRRRTPEQVVETCLAGLGRHRIVAVDGLLNTAQGTLVRLMPYRLTEQVVKYVLRRG